MMLFCDGRLSSAVSRLPVRKSLNDVKFDEANLDFSLVGQPRYYVQYHHAKRALAYTVYSSIDVYSKDSLKDFSYLSVKPQY